MKAAAKKHSTLRLSVLSRLGISEIISEAENSRKHRPSPRRARVALRPDAARSSVQMKKKTAPASISLLFQRLCGTANIKSRKSPKRSSKESIRDPAAALAKRLPPRAGANALETVPARDITAERREEKRPQTALPSQNEPSLLRLTQSLLIRLPSQARAKKETTAAHSAKHLLRSQ